MSRQVVWIVFLVISAISPGRTQEEANRPVLTSKVFGLFQFWSVHEHGQEVWDANDKVYAPQDGRLLFLMRRARLGADFQYGPRVKARIIAELDQLGPVVLGDPNVQSPWDIGLLDAFLSFRISDGEQLNVTAGFFRPQISRESITAAWAVTSMDKSYTQGFPRKFLTGNPYGRTAGINVGGLFSIGDGLQLRYDAGAFSPGNKLNTDGTGDPEWRNDLLLAGRVALSLGDPEDQRYGLGHRINYFGKRKGISIALQAARGSGPYGDRILYGLDLLANSGPWQLDGEVMEMLGHGDTRSVNHSGHVRLAWNAFLDNGDVLQPFAMYSFFLGPLGLEDQVRAIEQGMYGGGSFMYSAGMTWHLNPQKVWLTLQYSVNAGDKGEASDGTKINYFFSEKGLGAIRRGNWLGIGIHLSLI